MSVINKSSYGVGNAIFGVQQRPIIAEIDPTANQTAQLGTLWINKSSNAIFVLTSVVAGAANWANSSGGIGIFTSLVVNPGNIVVTQGDVDVLAGNINVNFGSLDVAGNITSHNQITATNDITSNAGDIVALLGNIKAQSGLFVSTDDSNTAAGSGFIGIKNRAGGIVQTGDNLGGVLFSGSDGVTPNEGGAGITVNVVGTVGVGRVPAEMVFATTPDAVSAPVDRMTITADGTVAIAQPTTATSPVIALSTALIYVGAGVPDNALATGAGDLFIRTDPAGAASRLYIATGPGAWTNVTCAG